MVASVKKSSSSTCGAKMRKIPVLLSVKTAVLQVSHETNPNSRIIRQLDMERVLRAAGTQSYLCADVLSFH